MTHNDAGAAAGSSAGAIIELRGTLAGEQALAIKAAVEIPAERRGRSSIESDLKIVRILVGAFAGIENDQRLRRAIGQLFRQVGTGGIQPGAWVQGEAARKRNFHLQTAGCQSQQVDVIGVRKHGKLLIGGPLYLSRRATVKRLQILSVHTYQLQF